MPPPVNIFRFLVKNDSSIILLALNYTILCRNAIRDMVVRGAPAIAIAAGLALAVEVSDLDFTGTPAEAASFVSKKLEYLVSR